MKVRKSPPRHAIDISEEAGVRYLHFGSDWVQGAMRIARPWSLELEYTREMLAGLLFKPEGWPRSALLVGLGAGSLARFLYRYLPDCRITAVEINPQVEFIARQYFKLPDDPRRLDVVIGCGADYMLAGERHFDYILVDGFDNAARSGALATEPFFQACRARLADGGLLAVNLLTGERDHVATQRSLLQVFGEQLHFLPPCDSGNQVALAAADAALPLDFPALAARAEHWRQTAKLDLRPLLRRWQTAAG